MVKPAEKNDYNPPKDNETVIKMWIGSIAEPTKMGMQPDAAKFCKLTDLCIYYVYIYIYIDCYVMY